jgi:hypothetical protein
MVQFTDGKCFFWANFLSKNPEIQGHIQKSIKAAEAILVEAGLTDHQSGPEWYNTVSKFFRARVH